LWQGELAGASQALSQASDISYSTGNLHVALTAQWNLAQAEIELGRLSRATELCQQALAWGHNGERALPAAVGGVYISLAGVLYEQNKLAEAGRHLAEGLKFGEQAADLGLMALGQLTLARLKQAQGDWEHAFKLARITKQLARQYQSSYWTAQAAASQARLWLTQGQLEAAQQWAAVRSFSAEGPLNFLQEAEYLVWARLLLAQAQPAPQPAPAALSTLLKLLSRLQQAAQAGGRTGRVLQVMVLQALAQQRQGDLDQALATLEQTLPLAEPEGYVRLFVDEGEPLQQLLTRLQAKGGRYQDYVTALLAAFSPSVPLESRPVHPAALLLHAFLVEPLSERELEILRLIAAGLSNIEIAQKIVVTVGTVKWHLNNIYGKLNVRSRTQAIVKARELGLI
jgi:LuxR family maltose regulon positive regulatory protein